MEVVKFKKVLPEDEINKLMAASFLMESHKSIVENLLMRKDIEINDERFSKYVDEYADKFVYFEILKNTIGRAYIPCFDFDKMNWTIEYAPRLMKIEIFCNRVDNEFIEKIFLFKEAGFTQYD